MGSRVWVPFGFLLVRWTLRPVVLPESPVALPESPTAPLQCPTAGPGSYRTACPVDGGRCRDGSDLDRPLWTAVESRSRPSPTVASDAARFSHLLLIHPQSSSVTASKRELFPSPFPGEDGQSLRGTRPSLLLAPEVTSRSLPSLGIQYSLA